MEEKLTQEQLLFQVIKNTIELDEILFDIFQIHFGLEEEFNTDGDMINLKDRILFQDTFLQELGSQKKLKLIIQMIKETAEYHKRKIKFIPDFDKKFMEVYNIRNIFAHSLYPKNLKRYNLEKVNWEELHKKHTEFFQEIISFINKNMYIDIKL